MGACILAPQTGRSAFFCTPDGKASIRKMVFDDIDGAKYELLFDCYDSSGPRFFKGAIEIRHWRGKESCDFYYGHLKNGSHFTFKYYPSKSRFLFSLDEFVDKKELEADYVDYKVLIGKDIIGDNTYTDSHRM